MGIRWDEVGLQEAAEDGRSWWIRVTLAQCVRSTPDEQGTRKTQQRAFNCNVIYCKDKQTAWSTAPVAFRLPFPCIFIKLDVWERYTPEIRRNTGAWTAWSWSHPMSNFNHWARVNRKMKKCATWLVFPHCLHISPLFIWLAAMFLTAVVTCESWQADIGGFVSWHGNQHLVISRRWAALYRNGLTKWGLLCKRVRRQNHLAIQWKSARLKINFPIHFVRHILINLFTLTPPFRTH